MGDGEKSSMGSKQSLLVNEHMLCCKSCGRLSPYYGKEINRNERFFCSGCQDYTDGNTIRERKRFSTLEELEEYHKTNKIDEDQYNELKERIEKEQKEDDAQKLLASKFGNAFIISKNELIDIALKKLIQECNDQSKKNGVKELDDKIDESTPPSFNKHLAFQYNRVFRQMWQDRQEEEMTIQKKILSKGF